MTELPPNAEMLFRTTSAIDLRATPVRRALREMARVGILPEFKVPASMKLGFGEFAEKAPLINERSYMGFEHFRSHGERAGLHPFAVTRGFGSLVYPYGLPEIKGSSRTGELAEADDIINAFYCKASITITNREKAGLSPLPGYLAKEQNEVVVDGALTVESFLNMVQHIGQFRSMVANVGAGSCGALLTIARNVTAELPPPQLPFDEALASDSL